MTELIVRYLKAIVFKETYSLKDFLVEYIAFKANFYLEKESLVRVDLDENVSLQIIKDAFGDLLIQEIVEESIVLQKPLFKTNQGIITEFNLGNWILKI